MEYIPPPILEDRDKSRDVHREIRDALVDRFSYTYRQRGQFTLEVDDQHSATVMVGPNFGERRTNQASIHLGVIRRDINDLWRELYSSTLSESHATVSNGHRPHFWREPDPHFSYMHHSERVIQEWLDVHITRLADEACNFGFVSAKLEELANSDSTTAKFATIPRFMTALLDGWTDEAEQEFMAPMIAQLDEDWPDDPDKSKRHAKIDRIREWIAGHPDGIERELTG